MTENLQQANQFFSNSKNLSIKHLVNTLGTNHGLDIAFDGDGNIVTVSKGKSNIWSNPENVKKIAKFINAHENQIKAGFADLSEENKQYLKNKISKIQTKFGIDLPVFFEPQDSSEQISLFNQDFASGFAPYAMIEQMIEQMMKEMSSINSQFGAAKSYQFQQSTYSQRIGNDQQIKSQTLEKIDGKPTTMTKGIYKSKDGQEGALAEITTTKNNQGNIEKIGENFLPAEINKLAKSYLIFNNIEAEETNTEGDFVKQQVKTLQHEDGEQTTFTKSSYTNEEEFDQGFLSLMGTEEFPNFKAIEGA